MTRLLGTKMPSRTRDYIEGCIESGERMTKHTVAAAVHCHVVFAAEKLREYRDAGYIREVYWIKNGCQWVPVYASKGKRKAKPKPIPKYIRTKMTRARGYSVRENILARQRRSANGSKTQIKPLGLAVLAGV